MVFSFGVVNLSDSSPLYTLIGKRSTSYTWERYRRLLQELRFGSNGLPSIDPGPINKQLAAAAKLLMDQSKGTMKLWIQWEVALALDDTWLERHWDRIRIVWPSPSEGVGPNKDTDLIDFTFFHLEDTPDDIQHIGILAHQRMILRCLMLWNHRAGCLPIIPLQGFNGFVETAVEKRFTGLSSWFLPELSLRIQHVINRRI